MKISVILPTYNEKDNIVGLINEISKVSLYLDFELILVDDNSPDGTGKLVKSTFEDRDEIKVFIRKGKRGLAAAIRHGIDRSIGKIVIVMDTDFNHDPKMLPQMIKFLEYYDIVIGSRFAQGGGMADTFRHICSFIYNLCIRVILRSQVQDNLSGFFSIKREKLEELDSDKIFSGYGDYFFRLLFYAQRKGMQMLEIPVFYHSRKDGKSKTNLVKVLWEYTVTLFRLRFGA